MTGFQAADYATGFIFYVDIFSENMAKMRWSTKMNFYLYDASIRRIGKYLKEKKKKGGEMTHDGSRF